MAEKSMRPVVKYIKLGEFEVEFQDIFDPSNEKECQLIDTVVTGAIRFAQEIFSLPQNKVVRIDAGPKYYIGYYKSDPSKFIFHTDARMKETKWYLHQGARLNTYIICTGHSNDINVAGYHWVHESKSKKIVLYENFPGYETSTASMFYIDHDVPTLRPYNAKDVKAIAYPKSGPPPQPNVPFESVEVIKIPSYGDIDLTVHEM